MNEVQKKHNARWFLTLADTTRTCPPINRWVVYALYQSVVQVLAIHLQISIYFKFFGVAAFGGELRRYPASRTAVAQIVISIEAEVVTADVVTKPRGSCLFFC